MVAIDCLTLEISSQRRWYRLSDRLSDIRDLITEEVVAIDCLTLEISSQRRW